MILYAVPPYIYHDCYEISHKPVRADQKRFKGNVNGYKLFTIIIIIIFENRHVTFSKTYGACNEHLLRNRCETSHRSKLDNMNF